MYRSAAVSALVPLVLGLTACASVAPTSSESGTAPAASVVISSLAQPPVSASSSVSAVITLTLATAVDGNSVRVSGEINMPNGSKLSVGLKRTIVDPEAPNDPGHYEVDFAQVEVRDGRYSYVLVDNRKRSAADFVEGINKGEPLERHQRVGPNVEVTVAFSPQDDGQTPAAIAAAGGVTGPNLSTSPQRRRIGALTSSPYWTLVVDREFPKPS